MKDMVYWQKPKAREQLQHKNQPADRIRGNYKIRKATNSL
jgi:hypothetical protein